MEIELSKLTNVDGIGEKTLYKVREYFLREESNYLSVYDPDMHLERNTVNQGDCLHLMKGIPDNSIDMVLADLPYGLSDAPWDNPLDLDKIWLQYERIVKEDGAILLFGIEPFSSKLRLSNLEWYRYDWIWEKTTYTNFYFVKQQPAKKHEIISVFYKKQPTYNPQMEKGDPYTDIRQKKERKTSLIKKSLPKQDIVNKGERYPSSVQKFSSKNHDQLHPTQKSMELLEFLIETYTNEGELVLDNVSGSGATAIACINTDRDYLCIEMDKEYCRLSEKWISRVLSGENWREAQKRVIDWNTG